MKEQLKTSLGFAKEHGLYVSVGGEDASRADINFLIELMKVSRDLGGDRFRFCDTLGILDPFTLFEKVTTLRQAVPELDIEVHTHNDLGMATANAIAGIRAGARFVNTTVNGLGERAGNAALEEVVMGLKLACGIDLGIDTHRFCEISRFVGKASRRPVPTWKAVVGEKVFSREWVCMPMASLKTRLPMKDSTPLKSGSGVIWCLASIRAPAGSSSVITNSESQFPETMRFA